MKRGVVQDRVQVQEEGLASSSGIPRIARSLSQGVVFVDGVDKGWTDAGNRYSPSTPSTREEPQTRRKKPRLAKQDEIVF